MPFKQADVEGEYKKYKDLRKDDVANLKDWAEKQPHLPPITELQLILFLQSCYFSVESAKKTIDNFFTVRTHCPELFSQRDPSTKNVQNFMDVAVYYPLQKPTKNNYKIIYLKIMDADASKYVFYEQIKAFDMNLMLWLNETGSHDGIIILMDMQGCHIGHLARLSLLGMKKFFYYLQEAMPVRLQGFHFVNVVSFMDKVMALMRPFLKKELFDMMHIHTHGLESLYEFIEPDCLPKDLGGPRESSKVLHDDMKARLNDCADFFREEEKQIVDESRRPGKPKDAGDIFGIEGTFKKLDID